MFTLAGRTLIMSGASGKYPHPVILRALECGMNVCFMSGNHRRAMEGIANVPEKYRDHIIGFAQNPQYKLKLNRELAPDIYKEDSTSQDVLRWIYDRFGSIDVVVNASGSGVAGPHGSEQTDKDYWHFAACCPEDMFFNTMYAMPYLEKSKCPRVINVTADDGHAGGWLANPASASAKGGVISLTKALAREFGPKGITVNAVIHGHIEGKDGDGNDINVLTEEERKHLISHIPMGRMCTQEDLASAVLFFASEESSFITGQVIDVNGGLLL